MIQADWMEEEKMSLKAKTRVLCTGGVGYIGSHTVVQLLQKGYDVCVLDFFGEGSFGLEVLRRIELLTKKKVSYFAVDLKDYQATLLALQHERIDAVIHFAGFKSVSESISQSLEYYQNNVIGTINLLLVMREIGCKRIVFSSTAAVYKPIERCLTEADPVGPSNPYGQSKLMIEKILSDLHTSEPSWCVCVLRYFNPVGAHPSGLLGESSKFPNNLLPTIQQVAIGAREKLVIHGSDWDTPDGTGIRDYLDINELADGHVHALHALMQRTDGEGCCKIYNLGTGKGISVKQMIKSFEEATGRNIPFTQGPRRPGDLAKVVADPSLANLELNWTASTPIRTSCETAWKWQCSNPNGYL
uniref:UDP-glucose 4-epimerase n=1 Tax=Nephromyces sp. MMRI TaxID=2496275 RepID=A0A3S5HLV6_9APIC|nr:3-hydroxymethyl-3-methylglutaryl-CoA lyase [Nephromyces sp. MMRI]AZL94456.1 3-hydroxymethyl-3-methylglutaryl-CoA lyase [Nephromyces sp. MMRI]AZL94457.1 3-hydroxymethyl-3-methylglutaryl-CoA lyase [Nephromyces sp. MMRI]AZL94458.1 3-hydroxymethyl-3-methylglutaryl-CoA lyase [Nephromyces sp. MMRI]